MFTLSPSQRTPAISFESLNWIATEPLSTDQTQSQRLHEPEHHINTIDRITVCDIEDVMGHLSLVDSTLTISFETETSRKAHQDMSFNHPDLRLPFKATDEDDRGE